MAKAKRSVSSARRPDRGQKAHGGSSCVWIECSKHSMLAAGISIALALASVILSAIWFSLQSDQIREMSQFADLTYSREVRIDAFLAAHGIDTEKQFGPIPKPPSISTKEK